MTKNITKKLFLVFFVTLFLLYIGSSIHQFKIEAVDYQLSSAWLGSDLDIAPQESIVYDSDYRYFSEIIASVEFVNTDKIYVIESAYDLYMLSVLSMGLDKLTYLNLNYVLGNDIDYYEIVQQNINQRFHPIGFIEPFTGSFDGQGFEITNLYFDSIMSDEDYQSTYSGLRYVSMFSKISSTAHIHNLGLINPIVIQPIEWGIMTYVSALVGENNGLVENVYLIDNRGDASGFNAEGNFHLSGLVSVNYGTFKNSFVASEHIKSISVGENQSTSAVLYQNFGTVSHLYYDSGIYTDINGLTNYSQGLTKSGFQNPIFLGSDWFYNNQYQSLASNDAELTQFTLTLDYPILQGLKINAQNLELNNATDFIYMNELFNISGAFRNADYLVCYDIDMNQISSHGYQAASVGFNGSLKSQQNQVDTILYERLPSQGGDINYHTILNLKINQPTFVGNYSSYSLFSSLFGIVENLNIANAVITTDDLDDSSLRSKILIGTVSGQMNHGTINNVHVSSQITVSDSIDAISQLSVGGLIGEGSGTINYSTTNGIIIAGSHTFDEHSNYSSTGGMIGKANFLTLSNVINKMDIQGISFNVPNTSEVYLGGVIGSGTVESIEKTVNLGNITSNEEYKFLNTIKMGGIFGQLSRINQSLSFVYNSGSLNVVLESKVNADIAGIGNIDNSGDDVLIRSLTNQGSISFVYPAGSALSEQELSLMNVNVSGVLITNMTNGTIEGLFNQVNLNLDLDIIKQIAGTLIAENTDSLNVFQLYNTGNLNLATKNILTQDVLMVSGNAIGSNVNYEHLRNEGNITLNINHATSTAVTDGNLFVFGLFNEVSQDYMATNGFNGGDIAVNVSDSITVDYNLYASGIAYSNQNSNLYSTLNLDPASINITYEVGSLNQVLNDGSIVVRGQFKGSVRASGIVTMNSSLLTSAINLGSIELFSDTFDQTSEIEAAGLVYLMDSMYAQIRDSANYGIIKAISNSTVGFAHASGIALRNDRNVDGTNIVPGTTNQLAKILFSINYGDVHAFSAVDESLYTITNESTAKAAGILTIGLLSVVNNVNYGNIYSKSLASGIFGFIYMNKFGTIDANQVYISNSINYGKVRQITAYDNQSEVLTIIMSSVPSTTNSLVFGAFVGKIHTGTTTWAFAGNVTYPIDRIYFGYLVNFDEKINMFALAPALSTSWADGFGNLEAANDAILNMLQYMATTNPNDQSAQPFTYFYSGGWIGQNMGVVIKYYDVSELDSGMFYESFPLRSFRPVYTGTDQYIRNYIEYIPLDKVNPVIISKIEADTNFSYPGIYALSSSKGIENGVFIPDNFSMDGLHPHTLDEVTIDKTWLGDDLESSSISYKLYTEMRQIKANFATSIYDMELKQVDSNGNYVENGFVLDAPIIDSTRGLITYYLPSNAAILSANTSSLMDVYRFVEVSEGLGRKVPDIVASGEQTYTWVGDYKKSGDNFVEIGPYHTTGIYNPTTPDTVEYSSTSRSTPVYAQTSMDIDSTMPYLYEHTPHTRFIIWWTASGYRLNAGSVLPAGYGAYEPYALANYPTLYKYVGPSQELVTYIRTDVIQDVTVFDESSMLFKVNNENGSYIVSDSADISYDGQSLMTAASIPRSFGIYDSMYDASNNYIDGVSDHYGSVRIYSASYDISDPSTYRDYDIRIIRTADQSLLDIDTLIVNGIDGLPVYSDFRSIASNQSLYFEKNGLLGILSVTYNTRNIADQTNVIPWIALYNDDTGDLISSDLYVLLKSTVNNPNVLDNSTGVLGDGTVTIDLEVTDLLPSGSYRIELKLVTDEVCKLYVNKIKSSNASITTLEHDSRNIALLGDTYTTEIPFGIYYNIDNTQTDVVNFSNIDLINNVYFADLNQEQIPSYLTSLEISPFSTLKSVSLNISMLDSYRHMYRLTYVIEAEDGTLGIFYHELIESALSQDPLRVYQNGGEIEFGINPIEIGYLEAPTIRTEFDLSNTFGDNLNTSTSFVPENIGDTAILEQDYYISMIPFIGFEVDLNQDTSLGLYQIDSSYDFTTTIWGYVLVWHFDFISIEIVKVKNDDSHLKNVMFVSDTIYSGFNTVVDVLPITEASYSDYLINPENRIITVLPTTGIYYGDYTDYQNYWVIGQVQKTNLSYYMPTFELPDGAIIRRVIDFNNINYNFQSEELATDFSTFGTDFNFVVYRIYAHDFDENQTHYSDYYIAVQDMTNNIKFNLEVINNSSQKVSDVFVRINVCQLGENYEGLCLYQDSVLSMISHAIYNPYLDAFENNQFQTTVYGTYQMIIDVPDDIGYSITLESNQVMGSSFYLENSILPRKYYIVVTLFDEIVVEPWGQQIVVENISNLNDLDLFRTYQSGELFSYLGQIYKVQNGYTYTYSDLTKPGTSALLGLVNTSYIYDQMSTYVVGDVVYYQNAYYESLLLNDLGYAPDATGIGLGYFVQIT